MNRPEGQKLVRRFRRVLVRDHLRVVALLLTLPAIGLSPASSQDTPETPPTKVHGTVINSVTRDPIQRALVFTPDNRFATLTDDHGHFELNLASNPPGVTFYSTNLLSARRPGYFESSTETAGDDITIALVPEASIIGRVSVPKVSDLDRMTISVYRRHVTEGRAQWTQINNVVVRSNGDFRVTNLAAGTYKIFTNEALDRDPLTLDPRGLAFGYPPVYFPAATNFATAATIQLSAGQTFQATLSPMREAYYPIKIPVVQSGEEGYLDVVVSQNGQRGPGFTLGYDPQQHAIFGSLPNGNYTVEAVTANVTPQSGAVNINIRDAPLAGPTLTLVPVNFVALNIDDQMAAPREIKRFVRHGITLGNYAGSTLTPADDFGLATPIPFDYTRSGFPGARPGRYWLRLNVNNGYVASARSGNVDLLREPLTVGIGGTVSPIEVVLRDDFAQLEGTVEGIQAKATSRSASRRYGLHPGTLGASAYIYCLPLQDEPGVFRQMFAQQEGTFANQQMPPGSYRVLAFDREQPELDWRNTEAMRAYESKGQVIHLVAGQKEHLRLQLVTTDQ